MMRQDNSLRRATYSSITSGSSPRIALHRFVAASSAQQPVRRPAHLLTKPSLNSHPSAHQGSLHTMIPKSSGPGWPPPHMLPVKSRWRAPRSIVPAARRALSRSVRSGRRSIHWSCGVLSCSGDGARESGPVEGAGDRGILLQTAAHFSMGAKEGAEREDGHISEGGADQTVLDQGDKVVKRQGERASASEPRGCSSPSAAGSGGTMPRGRSPRRRAAPTSSRRGSSTWPATRRPWRSRAAQRRRWRGWTTWSGTRACTHTCLASPRTARGLSLSISWAPCCSPCCCCRNFGRRP